MFAAGQTRKKVGVRVEKVKRKRCGCGELYEPQYKGDNICPVCRYYLRALRSKDVHFVERMRHDYIERYGGYLSYGQFVALLEQMKRRRKVNDAEGKKENTKKLPRA